jgi:integrase
LTGARRGEVAAMRWDEIDLKAGTWKIPSEKTKNRQAHTIFLSSLAIELIEILQPITGQSFFIFDTGLNSNGHIHTDALTRSLRRLMKKDTYTNTKSKKLKLESNNPPLADMKPFTVHDIRRAVATACGEYLKVKPHVIERMLNHQPLNRLVRTYQRAMYPEEQKAAWLAWGEVVEHQIAKEHTNIVPIKSVMNA